MENRKSVDQTVAQVARLLGRSPELAAQGSVQAGFRERRGRRYGPYYRLAYRRNGKQRSVYLGGSADAAAAVRALLSEAQRPAREELERRKFDKAVRRIGRGLRRALDCRLQGVGLRMKGYEIRGWSGANGHGLGGGGEGEP